MLKDKVFWLFAFVFVACIATMYFLTHLQIDDCNSRGGQMVGTGHYTTTYMKLGDFFIPITSEIYACSK